MIGISLLPAVLGEERPGGVWGKIRDAYLTPEDLLHALYGAGVRSVELRPVKSSMPPEKTAEYVRLCQSCGCTVTVHAVMDSFGTAVEDVFRPLSAVLAQGLLDRLTVTVHARASREENVQILRALSERAERETCRITFGLENGRLCPGKVPGESSRIILDTVKETNRRNVKITWDFGHMWFAVNDGKLGGREYLPDPEFIRNTVHTHIHGLRPGDMKTHFPPSEDNLPLSEWMTALSFDGVYNFEPEPERWTDDADPAGSLIRGVRAIAAAVPDRRPEP